MNEKIISDSVVSLSRGGITIETIQLAESRFFDHVDTLARSGHAGAIELSKLLNLAWNGGECPRCGNFWKKIEFGNQFGSGYYYEPTCECYMVCPHCGEKLYREQLIDELNYGVNGEKACPKCSWILLRSISGHLHKQWGRDFVNTWYNTMTDENKKNNILFMRRHEKKEEDTKKTRGRNY